MILCQEVNARKMADQGAGKGVQAGRLNAKFLAAGSSAGTRADARGNPFHLISLI
jgi:hypothetical protein